MDSKVLEYIIAIADEKSISRAADKYFLSPAALSQHLKKIEERLGAHLFIRIDGELCLTDVGKIYINGARSMLYIQNEALDKIGNMRVEYAGSIRLMVDERTVGQIREKIIPIINKKLPLLEIKLLTGFQDITREYLLSGMADIGIMTASYTDHEKLDFYPLQSDELVLVLPSSNRLVPLFERSGIVWDKLASDYFILNKAEDGFRALQQEILNKNHFHAQTICEVDALHTARHMTENGLGDTILPLSFLEEDQPAYRYFRLDPPSYIYTSAVCLKTAGLSKPIKDALSILRENFKLIRYYHDKS